MARPGSCTSTTLGPPINTKTYPCRRCMAAGPDERKDQHEPFELVHRGVHWCRWCRYWCRSRVVRLWWWRAEGGEGGERSVGEGNERGHYGDAQGGGKGGGQKMARCRASEGVQQSRLSSSAPLGAVRAHGSALPPALSSRHVLRSETWTFRNYALPAIHEAIALSLVSRSLKSENARP